MIQPVPMLFQMHPMGGQAGVFGGIGILSIIIGILYCFFGYRIFKVVLFITGALIGAFAGSLMGNIIAVILGAIIFGILAVALYFVGIFLLGAILGGGLIFLIAVPIVGPGIGQVLAVIFAVFGGVAALFAQRLIIILATAFTGAVMIIDGFFAFSSGHMMMPYPGHHMWGPDPVSGSYLIRLLLVIVVAVVGMFVQFATTEEPRRPVTEAGTETGTDRS